MDLYIDPRFDTGNKEQDFRRQKAWLIGERIKCDNDLLYFTRFFFKAITGNKFIIGDHHSVIANELKKVDNYERELLSINIPPRFSKTELAAVNYIARGIGINPSANYLYITASDDLRAQTSIAIRDIVTHPLYNLMYPELTLKKDQSAKNLWRTTQRGGLKTCTIFGQITGFGAGIMKETIEEIRSFEGCIVLDDINKVDDSQSANAISEKVTRVVFNTVLSRKNSKDTPIINIQQRVAEEDITGVFMKHFKYDENTGNCKSSKHKFLVLPVVDKNNIPLWEWKHDLEDIERLKNGEKTASTFMTQYMQDVSDLKGNLFKKEQFSFMSAKDMDSIEKHMNVAVNDVADQGTDNYSFPWGFVHDQRVYIRGWIYNTDELQFNAPRTATIINYEKILNVAIEINNMGNTHLNNISNLISSDVSLAGKHETGNKHGRIRNYAEAMRNRIVFLREEDQDAEYRNAIDHMFRYKSVDKENKKGKLDSPDSMALLIWMLLSDDSAHKIWDFM